MSDSKFDENKRREREEELKRLMRLDMMERNIQEREVLSYMLASELHDNWRFSRKNRDGSYIPMWEKSTDEEWNRKNGVDEVDVANTDFKNLPSNWQYDTLEEARNTIDLVFADEMFGEEFDEEKMESLSSKVYEARVSRNNNSKDSMKVISVLTDEYESLPEEEKEKVREQIKVAIDFVKIYKRSGKNILTQAAKYFDVPVQEF